MFTLTESAASKVNELLAADASAEGMRLRVAVRPGGCSGFSYEMFFDAEVNDDDSLLDAAGAPVVLDEVSARLLESATLDYRDGLTGAGFKITNPGANRTCGCGQSFS